MSIKNAARTFLFVSCAASMVGCAFGTRQVTLTYPPDAEVSEDGSAVLAATLTEVQPNGITVGLQKFRDERSDKVTIGEVRNGYGMHTSDAVAENDVAEWITGAIEYELKHEGFEVITDPSKFQLAKAIVSGDVLTVFCKAMFSYEGEVSFYGTVSRSGHDVHKERYTAQGTAGVNWAARAASYGKSLGDALQKAAKAFVVDIGEIARLQGTPVEVATVAEQPEIVELAPVAESLSVTQAETARVEQTSTDVEGDDIYRRGHDLFESEQYDAARNEFRAYGERFPQGKYVADSLYWRAHSAFRLEDFGEAIRGFDALIYTYPTSDKVPAAMHNMGVAYTRTDETEKAIEILQQLVEKYPDNPFSSAAKTKIDQLRRR